MSPRIFQELAEFAHYCYRVKLRRDYLRLHGIRRPRHDANEFYGCYGIFLDGVERP
jgi:hypothetical protein